MTNRLIVFIKLYQGAAKTLRYFIFYHNWTTKILKNNSLTRTPQRPNSILDLNKDQTRFALCCWRDGIYDLNIKTYTRVQGSAWRCYPPVQAGVGSNPSDPGRTEAPVRYGWDQQCRRGTRCNRPCHRGSGWSRCRWCRPENKYFINIDENN